MKRYLAETIELGLFLLIYLFPVHSFAQETVEQVLQFEHTVMNIGTLSEDDDPAMYHFKYHNVSKKPIYLSKLTTSCVQSPNQKIPDRKTKCVIKTHINIKQNVIFGAKLKPV